MLFFGLALNVATATNSTNSSFVSLDFFDSLHAGVCHIHHEHEHHEDLQHVNCQGKLERQAEADNKTEIDEEYEAVCHEDVERSANNEKHQWQHKEAVEVQNKGGTASERELWEDVS